MDIPYSKLPGYNQLFIDYVNDYNIVSQFYEYNHNDINSFRQSIEERKQLYNVDRNKLTNILTDQNKSFNSSEKAFENISKLKSDNTFAIVTGQQIGLLTGNYYTIIKAINAVQLSDFLSEKLPEYNFVPLFWLECDDHDFLEINNINIFDKNNDIVNLKYFEKGIEKEKYNQPVGTIIADETMELLINDIFKNMLPTEFSEELSEYSKRIYKNGLDLKTSFGRFLNYVLKDSGLILLDPTDKEVKKMLLPIFEKELNTFPQSCELMIDISDKLELRYEPQIKPKPVNLFYLYESGRYLIEPTSGDSFSLKNTRQKFEKEYIMDNLYSHPENFSPNVALRPVCQDYILPTAAYIGGPSEVSYLAQLKHLYRFFNNKMPVIFPRTSVTIIENRIQNFLLKYDISFDQLFDEHLVANKIMKSLNAVDVDDIFSAFAGSFNGLVYETGNSIRSIDKNLEILFRNKSVKFIESLDSVKKKLSDTQIAQNENTIKKLKSIISNVYPDNYFQERYINIVYFINKYGNNIINTLYNNINLFAKGHQNILVSS